MKLPEPLALLFHLLVLQFLTSGSASAASHQVTFHVHNKCPFPIWPATAPNTGHPVIADGGFYLATAETKSVNASWGWSGRFWARTRCDFTSNPACDTGDCGGRLACNGLIGTPPATLVEVSIQADKGKLNFYDVSVVDGYNLPVSVLSKDVSPKCTIGGCSKDLKSSCPVELQVVNTSAQVVACKSACLAFNTDRYCCRNEYGSPEKCKPTAYSKMFKEACPSYSSYAFDAPSSLVTCASKEYVITFCPASWGTGVVSI